MSTPLGRILTGLFALALALSGLGSTSPATATPDDDEGPPAHLTLRSDPSALPSAMHGRRAVRLLGDDLARVAALNGMTGAHLRSLLLSDRSVWVDPSGRVFYKDALPATAARPVAVPAAPYPLNQTFLLQSKPGSAKTIYLDFDGATVSGTYWNGAPHNVSSAPNAHPAWDMSGNGPAFSDAELEAIQYIWQQVSEDYAPFDVNVTTQDLGLAAINRDNQADSTYGSHALITDSTNASAGICQDQCGGVAFIDVFSHYPGKFYPGWGTDPSLHSQLQPAWVFPHMLSDNPKSIAEATTHEVGHNLTLEHDGVTGGSGYYEGHPPWAPIMGAAYDQPVTQFSNGSYSGANNTAQDDVAMVGAELGLRADESGDGVPQAGTLPTGTAYITSRTDRDTFALGGCDGPLTVTANPAPTSPNLDIELSVLDAGGAVKQTANPGSAFVSEAVASGMSATLNYNAAPGSYFVRVDGVGNGTPSTGYDDYGTLGAYTLSVTGCAVSQPQAPTAPQGLTASPHATEPSITVAWTAPLDNGGSPITGYQVSLDGVSTVELGAAPLSHTFSGLAPGTTYTLNVKARNANGLGAPASGSATTAAGQVTAPSAPRSVQASWDAVVPAARLHWDAPANDGGTAVEGYRVFADNQLIGETAATTKSALITGDFQPGASYQLEVCAFNSTVDTLGCGPSASDTLVVPGASPPGAPRIGDASSGKRGGKATATARWSPPKQTGGAPITGYQLLAYRLDKQGGVVKTLMWTPLPPDLRKAVVKMAPGRYKFAVRARNSEGLGGTSQRSKTVKSR